MYNNILTPNYILTHNLICDKWVLHKVYASLPTILRNKRFEVMYMKFANINILGDIRKHACMNPITRFALDALWFAQLLFHVSKDFIHWNAKIKCRNFRDTYSNLISLIFTTLNLPTVKSTSFNIYDTWIQKLRFQILNILFDIKRTVINMALNLVVV